MKHKDGEATVRAMLMSRNDSEPLFSNSCVNWMLGCFELR